MGSFQSLRYLKEEKRIYNLLKKIFVKYFKNEGDLKVFFDGLKDKDKDKFLKVSFFYYHNWWKHNESVKNEIGSIALIIFVSLIEATISEGTYKDFLSWYRSKECLNKNREINELWNDYKSIYGANKKFIHFFKKNLLKQDQNTIIKQFNVYDNNKEKWLNSQLKDIAKILYKLRSDFVHDAAYVPIPRGHFSGISFGIKNKLYLLENITLDEVFNIFERGIIEYFKNIK